jgi:hypothetical protein
MSILLFLVALCLQTPTEYVWVVMFSASVFTGNGAMYALTHTDMTGYMLNSLLRCSRLRSLALRYLDYAICMRYLRPFIALTVMLFIHI